MPRGSEDAQTLEVCIPGTPGPSVRAIAEILAWEREHGPIHIGQRLDVAVGLLRQAVHAGDKDGNVPPVAELVPIWGPEPTPEERIEQAEAKLRAAHYTLGGN